MLLQKRGSRRNITLTCQTLTDRSRTSPDHTMGCNWSTEAVHVTGTILLVVAGEGLWV